jgi:uncharacterized protein with HEPN domain
MSEAERDILDYIQDILTSILEVEEFIEGMTFEDFSKDKKTVNAVIRSLEVLGEATRHIPRNIRAKYKESGVYLMTSLKMNVPLLYVNH